VRSGLAGPNKYSSFHSLQKKWKIILCGSRTVDPSICSNVTNKMMKFFPEQSKNIELIRRYRSLCPHWLAPFFTVIWVEEREGILRERNLVSCKKHTSTTICYFIILIFYYVTKIKYLFKFTCLFFILIFW
jgi:hypothetical protein